MDELQTIAFASLNKDLNSKLYGCGYMGEIKLRANGGSIQIFEFTVNQESCGMLEALVTANNEEYPSARQERQDELREQNHLLNRVRQRSGCNNNHNNGEEAAQRGAVQ